MADLTQAELQHLRHLIGAHETIYQKLNTYSSQAVDPQIKQIFTKFKELWKDKRYRSLMILLLYFIFFLFIFIFLSRHNATVLAKINKLLLFTKV